MLHHISCVHSGKYTVLTAHLLTYLFMRETKMSVYLLVLCTPAFIKGKLMKGTRS